jgi:hypothetical protein
MRESGRIVSSAGRMLRVAGEKVPHAQTRWKSVRRTDGDAAR